MMKKIKVTNWKGNEYEGYWNGKFYRAQVEGDCTGIYRIYVDDERLHIKEDEKERLLKEMSSDKKQEDDARIDIIKKEFDKLDEKAQEELFRYLEYKMVLKNRK